MTEKKDNFIGFQYPNIKKWAKIVDDSHFRTTSEIKRDMIASGNIGSGEKCLFDYESESRITPDNIISDVELALRNGRLDKADVQVLREHFDNLSLESQKESSEKVALDKAEKASKNRTAKIDEILDVNQS